jgi:sigma-B regulation protein RsbU (phosphoserine phosphatase)
MAQGDYLQPGMRSIRSLIDSLSIRTKIALGAGIVALTSWALLAVFSYAATEMLLESASKRLFEAESDHVSAELRATYEPVERVTAVLAYGHLVEARTEKERLAQVAVLVDALLRVPASAAIQVGNEHGDYFIVRRVTETLGRRFEAPPGSVYEADIIDGASRIHRRWFYDDALRLLASRELPLSDYDPRERPWYQEALYSPGTARTAPYIFFFMGEIGMTVSRTSVDRRSVVATDVTLASLSKKLAERRISPSAETVVFDSGGVLAWSGVAAGLVEEQGTLRRRKVAELGHPALAAAMEGKAPEGWLVHRALLGSRDVPSELIIVVPEAELLADVRARRTQMLAISFVTLALLIPLAWVFANRISTPLRDLHKAIGRVAAGDFNIWLPSVRSKDEVSDLNRALRTMRDSLKKHIEDLAAAIAARERLASELEVATRIQMSFVPGGGQFSKALPAARLFARVIPARAVGGDLYEVIQLADGRFFVAVGDVSDKGIPAALLMARVMTLAKLLVPTSRDLGLLASVLNTQLEEGNAESMFTTLFGAIVDPRTAEVRCVSAGHNPPVIVRKSGASLVEVESGRPLGLFEGSPYVESTFHLEPGERLVLYTDGVTEAFDKDRNEFGEARFVALLERIGMSGSAEDLGEAILREVSEFAGDAPQSDDITVLVLDRT